MTERLPAPQCTNMAEVRHAIDALDREIVARLAERLTYIAAAARIKDSRDKVRDEARIEDVLDKVVASAVAHGVEADFIRPLYRQLIEASIAHELTLYDARTR